MLPPSRPLGHSGGPSREGCPVSLVGELDDVTPPGGRLTRQNWQPFPGVLDTHGWCGRNAWMLRGKGQSGVCLGFPTASCLLNVHGGLCFSGVLPVPALPTTVSYHELHQCGKRFDIIIHLIDWRRPNRQTVLRDTFLGQPEVRWLSAGSLQGPGVICYQSPEGPASPGAYRAAENR